MNENNFVTNNIFHGAAVLLQTGQEPDVLFETGEKYYGRPVIYMLWNDINPELIKEIRENKCYCEVTSFSNAYRKIRTILHQKIEVLKNDSNNSTPEITAS